MVDGKLLEFEICFWAKKSDYNGIFRWLPLKQHLIDCMNISALLWEHWLSIGQKTAICNSLSTKNTDDGKKIARFLGGVHDIGKGIPAFQTKKNSYFNSRDLSIQLIDKLENNGFKDINSLSLTSPNRSHHALASQVILDKYKVNECISTIVGGHHGKPVDDKTYKEQLGSYKANYFQVEDNENAIFKKWENAQKNILDWVLVESGFKDIENLPMLNQSSQVILEGLLIMADWISSNEDYFPLIKIDEKMENINQQDRMKNGWNKWFNTYSWEPEKQYDIVSSYLSRFGFEPRDMQYKLADCIEKSNEPGIFIVEAPMGVGKTEAALMAVEQLAEKCGCNGMFFGLPTQATSNGIFLRIENWLNVVDSSDYEEKSLRLIHGKAYLNEDFTNIDKSINSNAVTKEDFNSWITVNQWFTGNKKSILDDFVVGTVDNFLLASLKQKHLALRHIGLSKKVVVIDEVHAYDSYMSQYLYRAIRWMGSYNIPVVILSATLPMEKRVELVEEYVIGTGNKMDLIEKKNGWDKSISYPLITYTEKDSIKQITKFEKIENKKILVKKLEDGGLEEENLIEKIENYLSDGGVAGIIVNTVRRGQNLTRKLAEVFGEENVELLHSSFISTERVNKENDLIRAIGKGAIRPYKKIIVGTQVIEQSLDIDFDILFTDIAPIDLLIQRIGRLHRHNIKRPKKLKEPLVCILGTNNDFEYEEGNLYIYGDYLLMRTQMALPEELYIPKDISILVQQVYSNMEYIENEKYDKYENLEGFENFETNLNEKLGFRYEEAKQKLYYEIQNKKDRASSYLLNNPKNRKNKSLIGWLKNIDQSNGEAKGLAQVRDIDETIEVIALKKYGSGYSIFGDNEDISQKIEYESICKKIATQTLKIPNSLSKNYNIDSTIDFLEKENMNKLSIWQKQPWLKGSLGIVFDENNDYFINNKKLHYDFKYGLSCENVKK